MSAKILALDTSTENCSVALIMDDKTISRSEVSPRGHTTKILPMVHDVLSEAGIALTDLDALAFGRGPGSFTGVRIGVGIAQGLAFGAELPMIGISTLAAMAQGTYRKHNATYAACAIDARMDEIYWGRFERQEDGDWMTIDQECVLPPQEVVDGIAPNDHTWALAGTGWAAYSQVLSGINLTNHQSDILYPEAQDIAFLAQFEWKKGHSVTAEEASPVYLRDKVAWKKLPGRE